MGAAALPVLVGTQIAGGVYSAYGAENEGIAQEGYYRYLAGQADSNARLTELAGERQARSIKDAAHLEYGRLKRSQLQLEGSQKAALGAQGISGSVTAEDIARDTMNAERLDEMAIRFNADSQADEVVRQAQINAIGLRTEAEGYRTAGGNARRAGRRNAYASIIGSATAVAGTFAAAYPGGTSVPRTQSAGGVRSASPKLNLLPKWRY